MIWPPTTVPASAPDEDEQARGASTAAGSERRVTLVERRRPEAQPGERTRRDRRADHQRSQRGHGGRDPHVTEQRADPVITLGRGRRRRAVALAATGLGQPPHDDREERSGDADDEERPAPAERRRDDTAEHGPERGTDERQDAVVRVRPPAHVGPVVVRDERLRGGVVDRLANTERGAHREELPVVPDRRVQCGHHAPRRHHDGDDPRPPVAIGEVARRQRDQEPGEHERGAEEARPRCHRSRSRPAPR